MSNEARKTIRRGRVVMKSQGKYAVNTDGAMSLCSLSSKLRKRFVYSTADDGSGARRVVAVENILQVDPVAVGDWVEFVDPGDGQGMIVAVQPRRNRFSRRSARSDALEQIVAANIDQVVAVISAAKPKPEWPMLDRFLATAEANGIPPLICASKIDLVKEKRLRSKTRVYEKIGYRVVYTSAKEGRGIEELKDALKDKLSVLVGKSGVGKSTLLNTIEDGLGLRVREVSRGTGEGRHTTSHLEIYDLGFGGAVIDTPGMRKFDPWGVEPSALAELFPEMRPFIGKCHHNECSHSHEPDCAVKQAVDDGAIAKSRHQSYLQLKEQCPEKSKED